MKDTSRPGGQESDYGDALWELQTTWCAVVGQSCSSSFVMSCFCKRYTWGLGQYIHLSSDGIYIRMTNLFLSPDEGLGLHVKTQVKSGRQRFVAELNISASTLLSPSQNTHSHMLGCTIYFGILGKRT